MHASTTACYVCYACMYRCMHETYSQYPLRAASPQSDLGSDHSPSYGRFPHPRRRRIPPVAPSSGQGGLYSAVSRAWQTQVSTQINLFKSMYICLCFSNLLAFGMPHTYACMEAMHVSSACVSSAQRKAHMPSHAPHPNHSSTCTHPADALS